MEHFYYNIGEDWFTYPNLYKQMVDKYNNAKFVEVGAWKGRSACYMAVEIINSNKNIKFDVVDTWLGSDTTFIIKENSLYEEFINNINPVNHIINPVRTTSIEASKLYDDLSLDFVFIDASHKYEDVMEDLKHWYPKVKIGGTIAGHDYTDGHVDNWPGVTRAVNEFFNNLGITPIGTPESCFYYTKIRK